MSMDYAVRIRSGWPTKATPANARIENFEMSNVRVEKNGLVSQCSQIPKNALGHFVYVRLAGGAPLRKTIFQPAHFETTCAELRYRFVRQ